MAYQIAMSELGIAGDDTIIRGATPADVVEDVVEHLRTQHDLDMPDAREILSDPASVRWVPPNVEPGMPRTRGAVPVDPTDSGAENPGVQLVITRLREKLRLGMTDEDR